MLCKCSGKYIDIYFNLKITFLVFINVFLVVVSSLPGVLCAVRILAGYCPLLTHPSVQFLHITVPTVFT